MQTVCRGGIMLLLLSLIAACASLQPEFDPPRIAVESFRNIPSETGVPRFEIKLRVTNPNKQALDIAGISYAVEILGKELISGVSNDVPLIEGYSEGVVTLEAGLQLFQLVRLLAGLSQEGSKALDYRFSAKIDFNGFMPTQRVEETGVIDMSQRFSG